MTLSIDSLSAFIAVNDEGEGVVAFMTPDGQWLPMVAADKDRIDGLRPIAMATARATGKRIVLAEFSVRTDLEVIEP